MSIPSFASLLGFYRTVADPFPCQLLGIAEGMSRGATAHQVP